MNDGTRTAARMALPMIAEGFLFESIYRSVSERLSGVSDTDIRAGIQYAVQAVEYGRQASSGQYRQFSDAPVASAMGYNIRVRIFYDTRVGGSGMAGTIDVLTTAGSNIEAALDYAREHVRKIRRQEDTMPGGSGDAFGLIDPKLEITQIFGEDDGFKGAKTTIQG